MTPGRRTTFWTETRVELALVLGVACWLISAHWQHVDIGKLGDRTRLHAEVLDRAAPDPYQYKLWIIESALDGVARVTGQPMKHVWMANTLLSLLFLVFAHQRWMRRHVGRREALLGTVLLGALGNALFVLYYLHSYEFWGVGLFCLLLCAIDEDRPWWMLAVAFLLTGLVWEKHAALAVLWGLLQLQRGRPLLPNLLRGFVLLAAALAIPFGVRLLLGPTAELVDGDTPITAQSWWKVAWFQLPFIVPFAAMLASTWTRQSAWVKLLWVYLPVLVAAYVSQSYILHETRSFWALVPVFTATAVVWFHRPGPGATQPGPQP
ncbi:MAG: hypothetical protein O2894_03840 [Planctomycetota bacterium]|nr:hypothetical protein [Planctomycetota bacterium]